MKHSEDPRSGQPLSLAALRRALSEERFRAYSTPQDRDELDSVSRYVWNVALACAAMPSLHALEVTLRNNLFNASRKIVDESRLRFVQVPCWLDADPTLLYDAEAEAVRNAKHVVRRTKKPMTPGRLISNLPFGFWVSLCRSPYEQGRPHGPGLWPKALAQAFPFLPKNHRTRHAVWTRLDEIREFRNRVFHHESIWNRDLPRSHRRLLEVLSWMNQGVANALHKVSNVEKTFREGPPRYRDLAESLVEP